MDLEERVADRVGRARDRVLRLGVRPAVLLELSLRRLGRVARPVSLERAASHSEEAVFGAEHVVERLAQRPLPLRGRAVEIRGPHTGEHSAEVAVCLVVLREDALRLRRRATACPKLHAEIAELVMGHEQREAQAFFVVLAPLPGASHVAVREVDRRANELLDRLRDRLGQRARTGTPAIVSSAM